MMKETRQEDQVERTRITITKTSEAKAIAITIRKESRWKRAARAAWGACWTGREEAEERRRRQAIANYYEEYA